MNREENITKKLNEHWEESLEYFDVSRILGLFLQGSQNYGLDYEKSDVDTKLIVLPTLDEIAFNKKPVSTTHVRANEEHIDFKDFRLYIGTFKKQNLNFLEILFTPFQIVNSTYRPYWDKLVENREAITHYNPYQAVKSMKGIAMEKYHAMEHEYPSKVDVLAKFGYDPKQLHHLLRVEEYLGRYIDGEPYEDCLHPHRLEYLIDVKRGYYNLEMARIIANTAMDNIIRISDNFCGKVENKPDPKVEAMLDEVQYEAIKHSLILELKEG